MARTNFTYHKQRQMFFGVLSAVTIQFVPIAIYMAITSLNIAHPVKWLWTVTSLSFSLKFWFSLIPIFIPMLSVGYLFVMSPSNSVKTPTTRFNTILSVFSINIALKGLAFTVLSVILPFTYAQLSGHLLYQPCATRPELRCLNSSNLYVQLCGFWVGIHYFIRYELFPKEVRFPLIIQSKTSQIRYRIWPAIKNAFQRTFTPVAYFVAIFYVTSGFFTAFAANLYGCIDPISDGFIKFFNPLTLLQSWLMASLVHFSMWSLIKTVKVFLTERYPFQVQELISALSPSDPFLQQHAFYSLYLMSIGRAHGVSEVFSLSQPGGIPHSWNAILQESLGAIKDFQINIENIYGTNLPTNPQPVPDIALPLRALDNIRLRRLADGEKVPSKNLKRQPSAFSVGFSQFINCATSFAPVRYIFSPTYEDQISSVLESSQHVVWAIESLALLTGRAIKEDKFGVVVNDIPSVVTSFLSLRSTLEKTKIGGPGKQRARDRPVRMRAALLCAVSRGLCRIAVTYDDYLDHLYLPPEAVKALKLYVSS